MFGWIDAFIERIPGLVVLWLSLSVHEWAHARAASALGDDTANAQGRMSMDPLVHVDGIGTILLPIVGIPMGWARPVPVNPSGFSRRWPMTLGMALCAAAGPASNLLIAALAFVGLAGIASFAPGAYDSPLGALAWLFLRMNLILAVFNLLPVPPLDGSRLVNHLLPRGLRGYWERLERAGPILVFFFLAVLGVLQLQPFALLDASAMWALARVVEAVTAGG